MWKYPSLLFSTWSKKNGEKQIQELVDAASVREQPIPSVHSCTSVRWLLQSITAHLYKTLFGNNLVIELQDMFLRW